MAPSLEESIALFTSQTSRNIIRFLSMHLREYELTPEQWTVLKRLAERDGISQKELSQFTDKDQATMTRILDILERKDLIRKRLNTEDRRSFLIDLTGKGKALKEELHPFVEDLFDRILLRGIPREKLDLYKAILVQINENIVRDLGK